MTKVTPTARRSALAAGVTAVAALGAVAGTVSSAHAALAPGLGGLPLTTNPLDAVRGLVQHNALKNLPVLGDVSGFFSESTLAESPSVGAPGAGRPETRSRVVTQPAVVTPAPAAAAGATATAAPAASAPGTSAAAPVSAAPQAGATAPQASAPVPAAAPAPTGLTGMIPGASSLPLSGLESALPIGGLAGKLPLGGGLLGGLTGGLGHLG